MEVGFSSEYVQIELPGIAPSRSYAQNPDRFQTNRGSTIWSTQREENSQYPCRCQVFASISAASPRHPINRTARFKQNPKGFAFSETSTSVDGVLLPQPLSFPVPALRLSRCQNPNRLRPPSRQSTSGQTVRQPRRQSVQSGFPPVCQFPLL